MELPIQELRASIVYQHLVRLIVPRPIAWVSTLSSEGVSNLAPFSFFTGVGSRPPTLLFCPANRLSGQPKDTLRNIRESGEFVVNMVPESLAGSMNDTAAELPEDESEFVAFGVRQASSVVVGVPRVAESPVSIECRLWQEIAVGTGPGGANIVIGEIVHAYICDSVLDEFGFADSRQLGLIGRMGGASYARTQDTFDLQRPI